MKYRDYLNSSDWKNKKTEKNKKRRNCGICGSRDNIEIHHLNYKQLYDAKQTDLRRLCHRCHFLAHKLHKEGEIVFRTTNHHHRWGVLKAAVKRYLGLGRTNMFSRSRQTEEPPALFSLDEYDKQKHR